MELIAEMTPNGVLLSPVSTLRPTKLDEVAGCLKWDGRRKPSRRWTPPFWKRHGGRMIAVDTNVVVRLLTADDEDQHARARQVFASNTVYVGATVILDTAWVPRSSYRFDGVRTISAIRLLLGLPNVVIEDRFDVERSLRWVEAGLDFADALPTARARSCVELATFDRAFIRVAAELDCLPVRAP